MNISEAFGHVLRKYRTEANLSQEQLALQCDLDRTYIGLLERAQRQPTITTVFVLCNALNITPHEFIREVEEIM